MKIAVTGAHRTGKSTLVEALHKSLPGYVFKKEAYCQLEDEGHLFSAIPTLEEFILQLEYSMEQIVNSEKNMIFDRCPIDMLAYLQATNELGFLDFGSLYQKVESVMNELDLLVFIPIEEPDLIRCSESDLPELRNQVNEILYDLVWDFDLDVIEVSGSLSRRKHQVMKHLQRKSN